MAWASLLGAYDIPSGPFVCKVATERAADPCSISKAVVRTEQGGKRERGKEGGCDSVSNNNTGPLCQGQPELSGPAAPQVSA